MPGVGTGFNQEIKEKLFSFLEACYKGLLEQVELGRTPKEGIEFEFKEIKQYIGLMREDSGVEPEIVSKLLVFLESTYRSMLNESKERKNLKEAIKIELEKLEKYIDKIESKQKRVYGSIWNQNFSPTIMEKA